MILKLILAVIFLFPQLALAFSSINVNGAEDGKKTTGLSEIWHDETGKLSLDDVLRKYDDGEFREMDTKGSTGLEPGAFWSHFVLHNVTDRALRLHIEYIDHQLIELDAFQRNPALGQAYRQIADLALSNPFSARPISHNRFVFEVMIPPQGEAELMVKFSSHQAGFVFPSMRIWDPDELRATHTNETSVIMFMFGGIFLMSVIALVGAIATRDKTFLAYSLYAISKIIGWCTILGYTHEFVFTSHFHQRYMSMSGALTVFCGIIFARTFLQTSKYTPRIDKIFIFMMCNALFLLLSALFSLTALAVATMTVALLFYPMMIVAGYVRWRQGSTDAAVFGLAWCMLVIGIVAQAFRDLGLVEHNLLNYYWPAVASFIEMLGIMVAMGIKVRRLRLQKDRAELQYLEHLERSKAELEQVVQERTRELQKAKLAAEQEARTDHLTGIYNRRSFFVEAGKSLTLAIRKQQPLSLLMFDLDFFKSINDTYGHDMGDEALRVFSNTIKDNLRETDVWGRLGGEEFALVLVEDKQGTLQTAERLRKQIAGIEIQTQAGPLRLTASIGIAYHSDENNIEALISKADTALYEAKSQGRDQVIEFAGVA